MLKTNTVMTAAELEEQRPHVPEGFAVTDAQSANWVIRKIVETRRYAQHVQDWAAREVRRAGGEERFFLHRFGQQLEDWARRQLESEHGRRKSINLPAGSIGFRTDPSRLEITDENTLYIWCKSHLPAAIVVQESLLKSVIKDHIAATGELPKGAEIVDGGERFYVK